MSAEEELELVSAELRRLREERNQKFTWWQKIFGKLTYDGPETCGHCIYWKQSIWGLWDWRNGEKRYWLGDCKLLIGEYNKHYKETCHRFTPLKKYMRRIKWVRSVH